MSKETDQIEYSLVIERYPEAAEWLLEHKRAQVKDGKRLLSAEEKIELFGGAEQLRRRLYVNGDPFVSTVVLQACRQGAMTALEIIDFTRLAIGMDLDPLTLHYSLQGLETNGEKSRIQVISGITQISRRWGRRFHIGERNGWLTTDYGTRALNLYLTQPEKRFSLGGIFQPRPQEI
jgi:hypothetical protein